MSNLTLNGLVVIAIMAGCATIQPGPEAGHPIELSRHAFRTGNPGAADAILSKAIHRTPDRADLWNARGYVRMHLDEPHEAGMDFMTAIRLDPGNVRYRSNLAVLLLEHGDPAAALVELDRIVAMEEPSSTTLNHRGLAKSRLGRYEEALADFNEALERDARNARAYANRGVAFAKLGARGEAMRDFAQALAIDADLRQAYESRGLLELLDGDVTQAIDDFSRAIDLGCTDGMVFYNRAVAFSLTGEQQSAEEDYQVACWLGVPQGCLGLTDMTASMSDGS